MLFLKIINIINNCIIYSIKYVFIVTNTDSLFLSLNLIFTSSSRDYYEETIRALGPCEESGG